MDWINICRTCLTNNGALESIYSSPDPLAVEYEYSDSYLNMIKSVTPVSIVPNDTFPQQICQKCIKGLLIAFNFQKIAIKTEENLQLLQIPPENKILSELLLKQDMNVEEFKQEIFIPNKSDLSVSSNNDDIVQSQIKLKNPLLKREIEKLKQQIKSTKSVNKVINKKNQVKIKTSETLCKQLVLKSDMKKITPQEQQIIVKPKEIRIKSLQSLQNQNSTNVQPVQVNNNSNEQNVFPPWVSPPPLVFLSESKTTPPPLLLLPVKTVDNCKYCEMKFTTEYDLKIHLLTHEINFNCVTGCHFCWETPKDLLRHLKEHYKFLTCAQCKIKFDSISKYEIHMNDHVKDKKTLKSPYIGSFQKFTCRICKITLKTNDNICLFCKNQDKFLCRFCGTEFLDHKLFVRHEWSHQYLDIK